MLAMTTVGTAEGSSRELDALAARIAPRFVRAEPRRRALAYLRGLLAPLGRKNGWQLAEAAGDATPDGMQDFLGRMRWDADAGSATISGPTWSGTSATPRPCWCWTRPGSGRRASSRRAW